MTTWFDYDRLEPKRAFTYILSIGGETSGDDAPNSVLKLQEFLIKEVTRPGFDITETKHNFLNHTFYYPGRVEWKEINFTVVDVISPNTANVFMKILTESGYRLPKSAIDTNDGTARTISKRDSIRALGTPRIHQIDHAGNIVETWKMFGAWVKAVDPGKLAYDGDDLMNLAVTLRYDFAEIAFKQGSEAAGQVLPRPNR